MTSEPDHREFIATLYAPYKADPDMPPDQFEARTFLLNFSYRYVERPQDVLWLLEIVAADGMILLHWYGAERLFEEEVEVRIRWDGRGDDGPLAAAIYLARLQAVSINARKDQLPDVQEDDVKRALASAEGVIEQAWDVSVGTGPA